MTGIILAAGKSKRMGLTHSKVLLPLDGRPVLSYLIELAKKLALDPILIVVSPQGVDIMQTFQDEKVQFVIQKEAKGTAHAIYSCDNYLQKDDEIFILYGDTPLLSLETLSALKEKFQTEKADVALLTTYLQNPTGYGRIVRDMNNKIIGLIEENEADEKTRAIKEINVGVYICRYQKLREYLEKLTPNPLNGEYYLTTAISNLIKDNGKVTSYQAQDPNCCLGINTPTDWALVQKLFRQRKQI